MPRKKADKVFDVQTRISRDLQAKLIAVQQKARLETGKEIPFGEFLEQSWAANSGETRPDPLAALSSDDRAAVHLFIELLRDGGPSDKQLARLAIEAWTRKKTPLTGRAVPEPEQARTKSRGKAPRVSQ